MHWYVPGSNLDHEEDHASHYLLIPDVYGSNIGLTPKSAMEVPDDQVAALRLGSIHAFIAWLSYIFLAWSFKGVLLLLYNQLTYVTLP